MDGIEKAFESLKKKPEICNWEYNEEDNLFFSGCGEYINRDEEKNFTFCPWCGKFIGGL